MAIRILDERIADRVVREVMKVKSDSCKLIAIELEKQDRDLRRAILQVVWSSPNVLTEI